MKNLRMFVIVVFVLLIFSASGGIVSAHHSTAHYDTTKRMELRGTVVEFRWRNPHVLLFFDVSDSNGKVVQWIGEMPSPTSNIAQGITKDSLKQGDQVIVTFSPAKNGEPLGFVAKIVGVDGRTIVGRQEVKP